VSWGKNTEGNEFTTKKVQKMQRINVYGRRLKDRARGKSVCLNSSSERIMKFIGVGPNFIKIYNFSCTQKVSSNTII
jgi:hypothetical protein